MKSSLKKLLFSAFALMISVFATAQLPGDPPADDDPPAANINKFIVLFCLFAIGYGFYYIKNSTKKIIN